jgi:tungstate transport system ATP-binding protein
LSDRPLAVRRSHWAEPILPIRVRGLGFAAGGAPLLRDLDFDLEEGPRTVILGPNGAGKSLTLRLCHGLLEPSAGGIRWNGGPAPPAHRQAMVFQAPVMLRRSALANVTIALALAGMPRAGRAERARLALEQTGIAHLAERAARRLSSGEQQRLALARAWAIEPEVMFLDEPTANLDPTASRAIEQLILAIDRAGTKIVMTTHDLGQARRLADEILFLHQGRLLEQSDAASFFAGPKTAEGRAFLNGELLW